METRRITRSRSDRMVGGVAGGLGAYFGIDPLFVRIGLVVLTLVNGLGALLYLVLWLIVPNEGSVSTGAAVVQEGAAEIQGYLEGLVARVRAALSR